MSCRAVANTSIGNAKRTRSIAGECNVRACGSLVASLEELRRPKVRLPIERGRRMSRTSNSSIFTPSRIPVASVCPPTASTTSAPAAPSGCRIGRHTGNLQRAGDDRIVRHAQLEHVQRIDDARRDDVRAIAEEAHCVNLLARLADARRCAAGSAVSRARSSRCSAPRAARAGDGRSRRCRQRTAMSGCAECPRARPGSTTRSANRSDRRPRRWRDS